MLRLPQNTQLAFSTIAEIQQSKKAAYLEKRNCACMGKKNGNKRMRVAISSTSNEAEVELAAFNLVFENCPLIEMLEIGFNTR